MDLRDYQRIETQVNDIRFGLINIYMFQSDPNQLIMEKINKSISTEDHDFNHLQSQQRHKLEHPSLLKMIACTRTDSMFETNAFFEYPNDDLYARQRHLTNSSELVKFSMHMLEVLSYLQERQYVHGDLRPEYIFFDEDTQKYILLDRLSDSSSYSHAQRTNLIYDNKNIFMSPGMFEGLSRGEQIIAHDPFKSEVFSLGMIILSFFIEDSDIALCYDRQNREFDFDHLKSICEDLSEHLFVGKIEKIFSRFLFSYLVNPFEERRKDPKECLAYLRHEVTPAMLAELEKKEANQESKNLDRVSSQNYFEEDFWGNEENKEENEDLEMLDYSVKTERKSYKSKKIIKSDNKNSTQIKNDESQDSLTLLESNLIQPNQIQVSQSEKDNLNIFHNEDQTNKSKLPQNKDKNNKKSQLSETNINLLNNIFNQNELNLKSYLDQIAEMEENSDTSRSKSRKNETTQNKTDVSPKLKFISQKNVHKLSQKIQSLRENQLSINKTRSEGNARLTKNHSDLHLTRKINKFSAKKSQKTVREFKVFRENLTTSFVKSISAKLSRTDDFLLNFDNTALGDRFNRKKESNKKLVVDGKVYESSLFQSDAFGDSQKDFFSYGENGGRILKRRPSPDFLKRELTLSKFRPFKTSDFDPWKENPMFFNSLENKEGESQMQSSCQNNIWNLDEKLEMMIHQFDNDEVEDVKQKNINTEKRFSFENDQPEIYPSENKRESTKTTQKQKTGFDNKKKMTIIQKMVKTHFQSLKFHVHFNMILNLPGNGLNASTMDTFDYSDDFDDSNHKKSSSYCSSESIKFVYEEKMNDSEILIKDKNESKNRQKSTNSSDTREDDNRENKFDTDSLEVQKQSELNYAESLQTESKKNNLIEEPEISRIHIQKKTEESKILLDLSQSINEEYMQKSDSSFNIEIREYPSVSKHDLQDSNVSGKNSLDNEPEDHIPNTISRNQKVTNDLKKTSEILEMSDNYSNTSKSDFEQAYSLQALDVEISKSVFQDIVNSYLVDIKNDLIQELINKEDSSQIFNTSQRNSELEYRRQIKAEISDLFDQVLQPERQSNQENEQSTHSKFSKNTDIINSIQLSEYFDSESESNQTNTFNKKQTIEEMSNFSLYDQDSNKRNSILDVIAFEMQKPETESESESSSNTHQQDSLYVSGVTSQEFQNNSSEVYIDNIVQSEYIFRKKNFSEADLEMVDLIKINKMNQKSGHLFLKSQYSELRKEQDSDQLEEKDEKKNQADSDRNSLIEEDTEGTKVFVKSTEKGVKTSNKSKKNIKRPSTSEYLQVDCSEQVRDKFQKKQDLQKIFVSEINHYFTLDSCENRNTKEDLLLSSKIQETGHNQKQDFLLVDSSSCNQQNQEKDLERLISDETEINFDYIQKEASGTTKTKRLESHFKNQTENNFQITESANILDDNLHFNTQVQTTQKSQSSIENNPQSFKDTASVKTTEKYDQKYYRLRQKKDDFEHTPSNKNVEDFVIAFQNLKSEAIDPKSSKQHYNLQNSKQESRSAIYHPKNIKFINSKMQTSQNLNNQDTIIQNTFTKSQNLKTLSPNQSKKQFFTSNYTDFDFSKNEILSNTLNEGVSKYNTSLDRSTKTNIVKGSTVTFVNAFDYSMLFSTNIPSQDSIIKGNNQKSIHVKSALQTDTKKYTISQYKQIVRRPASSYSKKIQFNTTPTTRVTSPKKVTQPRNSPSHRKSKVKKWKHIDFISKNIENIKRINTSNKTRDQKLLNSETLPPATRFQSKTAKTSYKQIYIKKIKSRKHLEKTQRYIPGQIKTKKIIVKPSYNFVKSKKSSDTIDCGFRFKNEIDLISFNINKSRMFKRQKK